MNIIQKFKILTYNIGFLSCSLDELMTTGIKQNNIIWMKHNYKDRYFADPFLIKMDDKFLYVICEEYTFWEEKGKISLLKVDKKTFRLVEKKIIIEEQTHLSFPFCELNGDTITPESCKSGNCYKYTIDIKSWEILNKQIIVKEGLIDAAFYTDIKGNEWIFASKDKIPSTELFLYYKKDGSYKEFENNPVLCNNRIARSAGKIFEWHGELFRPVQDCKKRYGWQTKIMHIDELDINDYKASEHITINSFENPPYNETLHTLNVYDGCIVVDGSKDFLRFPMKFFYKKFRLFFKDRR